MALETTSVESTTAAIPESRGSGWQRGETLADAGWLSGLRLRRERLQRLSQRLAAACLAQRVGQQRRLELLRARLEGLDPQQVLARGFAWLADADGRPLQSARLLQVGQPVQARLADGRLWAKVEQVDPGED